MHSSPSNNPDPSSSLTVEIIETLEACGISCDEYQLYDSVDIGALEQVLNSSGADVEVQFTVEGIRLVATPESVEVLIDEESCSADE